MAAECLKSAMRTLHDDMLELTRRGGTQNAACDAAELLSQALSVVHREQSGASVTRRERIRKAGADNACGGKERTATSLARRTLSSREGGDAWYFELHFENTLFEPWKQGVSDEERAANP